MSETNVEVQVETHWQDLAAGYDVVMGVDPSMSALLRSIVTELPTDQQRILDLGTGTGALLQQLRKRYPYCSLVGLDPAPAMLEQARKKMCSDSRIEFILGSAHRIDAPDKSFDSVVSNFALHHLTHEQKRECSREVSRVLVPGGYLVYGDQHCRRMGGPDDKEWVEDLFELFCTKARHYLRTAGLDRMLLQVRLMPQFLLADGEIPATVEFWQECLADAGLLTNKVVVIEPEYIYHRIIVARKPPVD